MPGTGVNEALHLKLSCFGKQEVLFSSMTIQKVHFAEQTEERIRLLKLEVLPQPPHSPDLTPTDYHVSITRTFHI